MADSTFSVNKKREMDKPLLVAVLMLVSFGIVMVYSSSAVIAANKAGSNTYFLHRQIVFCAMGLFAMLIISNVDYSFFKKPVIIWSILSIAFLGILLCKTPLGHTSHGAYRWIKVGPVNIQPTEIMKVAIVLWLSYSLNKKSLKIKSFSVGFLPHIIIPSFVMLACLLQPDFGTAVIIAIITFILLFVAGAKVGYIGLTGIIALYIGNSLIMKTQYRLDRLIGYQDPLATIETTGWQLSQSWFGYASGEVSGVGLGDGLQKFIWLPEAHNDFIGAVIAEELGVIGIWAVMLVFAIVVIRGFAIGLRSKDEFGMYVSFGLSTLIAVQVLANLGVSIGLLPTKGLSLPFISYGGSALFMSLVSVGILLSISRGTKNNLDTKATNSEANHNNSKKRSGLENLRKSNVVASNKAVINVSNTNVSNINVSNKGEV